MTKNSDSNLFGFLTYFLGLIGFLIAILAKKDDKYVIYHAKQCLVLMIFAIGGWIALAIVSIVLAFIPVIGWIIALLLSIALWISILVLWIIGMINGGTGKEKPLPVIGQYGSKFKF